MGQSLAVNFIHWRPSWAYQRRLNSSVRVSNELQDMIIDFLHDNQDALRTCSLVCKSWLPTARFHRFRNNSKNADNQLPVTWAVSFQLEDLARALLGRNDVDVASWENQRPHPLCCVAMNGNEVIAKLLLARQGISVNMAGSSTYDHVGGSLTPLLWATKNGHVGIARQLLAYGKSDVNVADHRNARTPLGWAAMHGSVELVKLLLERNDIDVNVGDKDGRSALWWAAEHGNNEILKALLQRDDIDINIRDYFFYTPLHRSVRNVGVLKLLLERNDLDVNVVDFGGDIPLISAARDGLEDAVRLLLERDDIDVNVKDTHYGMTPMSWAAFGGHKGVVRILSEKEGVECGKKKRGETDIVCH